MLLIATGGTELGKVRTPSHLTVWWAERAQMASPPHVMSRLHNHAHELPEQLSGGPCLSLACFDF